MEKNCSLGRIKPSHVFPYWLFPTDPTTYPFPMDSKHSRHNLQTWHQWFIPYGFTIGPGLTRHPVFLWRSLCDAPPSQICCDPIVLGFFHIRSEGRGFFCEVDYLFAYLILTCNYKTSIREDQRVTLQNNFHATVTFVLKVRGLML